MKYLLLLLLSVEANAIPLASPRLTYVMQGVDGKTMVSDAVLSRAQGIVLRTKWSTIETSPNIFNLSWLQAQIARAKKLNKKVQLEILSGDDAPSWLTTLGAKFVGTLPLPWDAQFQSRYQKMLGFVTAHLDLSQVTHFHSIGANNAEWHYLTSHPDLYQVPEYSDQKMIDAHLQAIAAQLAAFPPTVIIVCDIGDHQKAWTGSLIDQLKKKYRGRIGFQMDSLSAKTSLTYAGYTRIKDAASQGHHAGFEMLGPSIESRFGGPLKDAITKADATKAQWMILYQVDVK